MVVKLEAIEPPSVAEFEPPSNVEHSLATRAVGTGQGKIAGGCSEVSGKEVKPPAGAVGSGCTSTWYWFLEGSYVPVAGHMEGITKEGTGRCRPVNSGGETENNICDTDDPSGWAENLNYVDV